MKITVEQQPQVEWNYPCFGIAKDGEIVLFKCAGVGMCISHRISHRIGYYSKTWTMECFTPFKGKITIEQ